MSTLYPTHIQTRLSFRFWGIGVVIGLLLIWGAGCASKNSDPAPEPLVVFAAASLTDAFADIKSDFEQLYPDVDIVYNFAGSQHLAHQLRLGVSADVFAPAHKSALDVIIDAGIVPRDSLLYFAETKLAIATPTNNPARISGIQDLARKDLKLVLAAEEVPAGYYTQRLLADASQAQGFPQNFTTQVLENAVSFEQSVRSVRTKVALGEADAGIVYQSDLDCASHSPIKPASHTLPALRCIQIPPSLNQQVLYPVISTNNTVSTDSKPNDHSSLFIRYLLSSEGQKTLMKHGFLSR